MPLKLPLRDRVDSESLGHLSRHSLFRIKFVKTSGPLKMENLHRAFKPAQP